MLGRENRLITQKSGWRFDHVISQVPLFVAGEETKVVEEVTVENRSLSREGKYMPSRIELIKTLPSPDLRMAQSSEVGTAWLLLDY
jgi:hypothetical protein